MADKFKKGKSNFATTLVTGIGTGTGDTITLNSTTGLPTDTEITLTFNRVTSGGVVNSTSVMERITGTISGSTLTSYRRGVDGTTEQAHAGGTVVEYIPNAADMNDQVDGILVGHNQDGTHKSGSVLTLPQINDTSSDHQYVVAVSELAADRTVTLPLLTGNDEFVFKDHTQTLTNKTIGTTNFISFNSPEGYLINGKIVPSVADDDLTVALKGLDGNDPSATNPVYCRIGDTVHAITAALSVTKADGTNWFNAGTAIATGLATKEIDYFVYLGYNATDGVVIGFARIPYATDYSQFSATTDNEKYCAISTITNAASGDAYTVIGRFAATLSAGAGYTWTVPTFTSINLIQRPIFETRTLIYLPTYTCSGSMTFTSTSVAYYNIIGSLLHLRVFATGTTGGTTSNTIIASYPFAPATGSSTAPVSCSLAESVTLGAAVGSLENGGIYVRKHDLANIGLGTNRNVRVNTSYNIV
jgi:hypothetical protein